MGGVNETLTPGSLKKAERELLEYSGIPKEEFEIKRVYTDEDSTVFMNTIIVGSDDKPSLVLVHGYAGSGALYYKVIRGLAENFKLYIIDLIGMGSSSRPDWNCRNGAEADAYFMAAIEQWRINVGNITDFYIAAHSYGGYLMGSYAAIYPQHVRKLILLSPLGCKFAPENFSLKNMRFMRGRGPPRWAVAIGRALWGVVSPFSLLKLRSDAKIRETISGYVNRHQPVQSEEEANILAEYLYQILMRKNSAQLALFQQFDPGLHALVPLSSLDKLCNPDLPFPVSVVYGQNDWMDSRGSREIVRGNKFFSSGDSQSHILPLAGHQLFMGNPDGFVTLITDDLLGRVKHNFELRRYTVSYVDDDENLLFDDVEFKEWEESMASLHEAALADLDEQQEEEEKGP